MITIRMYLAPLVLNENKLDSGSPVIGYSKPREQWQVEALIGTDLYRISAETDQATGTVQYRVWAKA